ncbi:MAG: MFS transporter [Candidatus Krumholzibacteriota bacterium]|nr:MFS transporter [Candidatus Krumholzibacteriota bacterium]
MDIRRFPRTFWAANTIELFERLAYYGMNVILVLYLTRRVGFSVEYSASITGIFIASLYLLPIPTGAISDKIGFKNGLFIAFSVLALGYAILGLIPSKMTVLIALSLIAVGGAFVKPVISGTIKKTSPGDLSRIGFSIFYMVVNIGGFTGKIVAKTLRQDLGRWIAASDYARLKDWVYANVPPFEISASLADRAASQNPPMTPEAFLDLLKWQGFGMQVICLFSVAMALVALALVAFAYREPDRTGEPVRSVSETFRDMFRLFLDLKFVSFIIIFAGFDLMFWQLYLSVPTYIVTHISETAPMEYIVAINPGMIIVFQMIVAALVARMKPIGTMALGMAISVAGMILLGLLPTLWGAVIAIAVFALGEMTFAPRFLDYVSTLAPKGKIGLYLGFAYMRSFIANMLGGPLSGYLLGKYCPAEGAREPYKMWFTFAFIGILALIALSVYNRVVGDQTGKEETATA